MLPGADEDGGEDCDAPVLAVVEAGADVVGVVPGDGVEAAVADPSSTVDRVEIGEAADVAGLLGSCRFGPLVDVHPAAASVTATARAAMTTRHRRYGVIDDRPPAVLRPLIECPVRQIVSGSCWLQAIAPG